MKVGWSAFYGTQNSKNRELTGPYALLGFNKHFYLLGEADLQFAQPPGASSTKGIATYERLRYEIFQGFHLYVLEQTYVYDFGGNFDPTIINPTYGIFTNRLIGAGPGFTGIRGLIFTFSLKCNSSSVPHFHRQKQRRFL